MNYQIELVVGTKQREKQDKIIHDGIISYNEQFIGCKPEQYSIYVKNQECIIAGAIVYSHKHSIYIDVIWVNKEHRGKGLGTLLLKNVEVEAIRRGIKASTLDTFSFQAEGFYLKQGYQHIGTIKDYLAGHDRIYLRKKL